jgi:hypothetical protein
MNADDKSGAPAARNSNYRRSSADISVHPRFGFFSVKSSVPV